MHTNQSIAPGPINISSVTRGAEVIMIEGFFGDYPVSVLLHDTSSVEISDCNICSFNSTVIECMPEINATNSFVVEVLSFSPNGLSQTAIWDELLVPEGTLRFQLLKVQRNFCQMFSL